MSEQKIDAMELLSSLELSYKSLETTKELYRDLLKEGNWWGRTNSKSAKKFMNMDGKVESIIFSDGCWGGAVSIRFLFPFKTAGDYFVEKHQYYNSDMRSRTYYPLSSITLFQK